MSTVKPLIPLIVPDGIDAQQFALEILRHAREFDLIVDRLVEAGVFTGQYRSQVQSFARLAKRAAAENCVVVAHPTLTQSQPKEQS